MKRIAKISFLSLFGVFLLYSCSPTRYLDDGELFLQGIKIKNNDHFSSYDLEEFIRQDPNRKFFLLPFRPYMHAYYYGQKVFDSTDVKARYNKKIEKVENKIEKAEGDSVKVRQLVLKKSELQDKKELVLREGNWLMRSVGEEIVTYDSAATAETADQLEKYMHSKGYFRSSVDTKLKEKRQRVKVVFDIEENDPYTIAYTYLVCPQPELKSILIKNKNQSFLKVGNRYTDDALSSERERITNLFKSNGYFYFHRRYVYFEVDSSLTEGSVHVRTVINLPDEEGHEIYRIANVYTTTDVNRQTPGPRDTVEYQNIHFLWYKPKVSEKILTRKIKLSPGQKYSYDQTVQTQKNLADMNMYKFVNINYYELEDSTQENQVNAYISMSAFQKYQFSSEFGVNVFQQLPGPFSNFTFRTRNLFKGAEVLDMNLRAGIEGQSSITERDILTTRQFGANISLTFPRLLLPLFMFKKTVDYAPQTQIKTGVSLVNRQEFTRDNFSSSLSYIWQKRKSTRSILTPIEVNVINTQNQSDAFKEYLQNLQDNNNPLYLSFRQSIITSIRYDFIFDNNLNRRKRRSKYFRVSVESGGTTLNFFKNDILAGQAKLFGLDYYQYLRGFTDFRYYIPTKNKNIVATRVSLGIGKPTGGTSVLPYEKYFFSGGSYSNRAWLPRRLGPGSYTPVRLGTEDEFDTDYRIEQPGELLFESNIEYRFRIKGVLDGALFTDVSNVWTINEDSREGAQFKLDSFYKELAVGSGFGLRFDFSFIILRFDIGTKIWDPALPLNERFTPLDYSVFELFTDSRLTVLNMGIGYPF